MSSAQNKTSWYNDPQMVGTLIVLFAPVGMYGLYKSETIKLKWKRASFFTLAVVCVLLLLNFLA